MSFSDVKAAALPYLLNIPGVRGVGGHPSLGIIKVYVGDTPAVAIPPTIGGYTVEIHEVGHIRALSQMAALEAARTGSWRPAPGGVSCGHPLVTAGTLGMAYPFMGKNYILSNCHVNAAADTIQHRRAKVGDPILQPGAIDGGTATASIIARLVNWRPLDEKGSNLVDWSLSEPLTQDLLDPQILDIGVPQGFKDAQIGMTVTGSGRTTAVKSSTITDLDASMLVDYEGFSCLFEHQILTGYMANGGDSGKMLLDQADHKVVGLSFSGSEYVTLHNHIADVIADIAGVSAPPTSVKPSFDWRILIPLAIGAGLVFLL